ncbi:MAG: LptA/OstA family protein [Thermovirgaceae bacterium]|nr:LptA/OstA family protein [Thermovirgaceae bacterium]
MKKFSALIGTVLILLFAASVPALAEQMRLTSDTLDYDPSTGIVKASGNVNVLGRGAEITSRFGEFDAGGKRSHLWDEVMANWTEGGMTMECADLVILEEPGGQHLTARSVKKFSDSLRKLTMRSGLMEGTLRGKEFSELVATGDVVADAVLSGGEPTRMTGTKAVYSKAKGTLIFSGSASATQKDRKITAETFIIHLESGRIEAIGNPRMVVDLPAGEGK